VAAGRTLIRRYVLALTPAWAGNEAAVTAVSVPSLSGGPGEHGSEATHGVTIADSVGQSGSLSQRLVPAVAAFSSQPFWLTWPTGTKKRRHAPDYFVRMADGTGLVIDFAEYGRIAKTLSPLGHAHLNCLGRYAFTTQPPAELRPLRDPNARDSEDGGEL
jgi:hypothetical protein